MTRLSDNRMIPRLALDAGEAAEALGVSRSHFYAHVLPHLRCVYSGRKRLVAIAELERWLDDHSGLAHGGEPR